MEPNGEKRALIATLTIEVTMDDEGREVVSLSLSKSLTMAYTIGVLELCKDIVLNGKCDCGDCDG